MEVIKPKSLLTYYFSVGGDGAITTILEVIKDDTTINHKGNNTTALGGDTINKINEVIGWKMQQRMAQTKTKI